MSKNNMNICVFSIVNYWHGVRGGMEIHGKLLTEGIAKRGHRVSIITTKHPDGKEYEEKEGVKIYYLKSTRFGGHRNNWTNESMSTFCQLHREHPFDVILSQSFAAYGLAYSDTADLNIPIVPILHGCIRQEISTFKNNLPENRKKPVLILRSFVGLFFSYYKVQKPLLSLANHIIITSSELSDDLMCWYGDNIANKSVLIFNGIDTTHFCPNQEFRDTIRKKHGIQDHETLLLTLGTVNREKGHHLAIEALASIRQEKPNVKLVIVGTGGYQTVLEKRIEDANLQNDVIFTGFVDNLETVKYYNSADIFLMPTLRIEGLPFVLLEAMSCGKPVIASRLGGNTSIVRDGENGLLAQPGNINELAGKIKELIDNDELAGKLSSSARKTILDQFNMSRMVDKTIDLMKTTAC